MCITRFQEEGEYLTLLLLAFRKAYEQIVQNSKQDVEADTADLVLDARSRER